MITQPYIIQVLAKYCKVNGLYVDAVSHYEKAIELAPESEMFKKEYNRFLKEADVKIQYKINFYN